MSKKVKQSLLQQALSQGKATVSRNLDGSLSASVNNKIRVLTWGASPLVITGFGIVMQKILQNLFRSNPGKYEFYQVGINFFGDAYDESFITGGHQNGIYRQWPAMQAGNNQSFMYGQQKFLNLLQTIEPIFDVVFLFEDPFWVGGPVPGATPPVGFIDAIKSILASRDLAHIPIVSYFPIDGVPKIEWLQNINKCEFPITYLPFGAHTCKSMLPELGQKLSVIPHGSDPNDFHPISAQERRTFRRAMFGDAFVDKYMVLNVNRNQLRKMIPATMLAFKEFLARSGADAFLYLNMKPQDVGWDLFKVVEALQLQVGRDVLFPPNFNVQKGLSQDELNKVFASADLLVSTALGGGWELAISQAFATKTPVLAPANTSHIDLCGPQDGSVNHRATLYASGDRLSHIGFFPHDNEVPRPMPNLDDMVTKMLDLYANRDKAQALTENAYKWVMENLSWSTNVVPKFDQIFTAAKALKDQRLSGVQSPKIVSTPAPVAVIEDKIVAETIDLSAP